MMCIRSASLGQSQWPVGDRDSELEGRAVLAKPEPLHFSLFHRVEALVMSPLVPSRRYDKAEAWVRSRQKQILPQRRWIRGGLRFRGLRLDYRGEIGRSGVSTASACGTVEEARSTTRSTARVILDRADFKRSKLGWRWFESCEIFWNFAKKRDPGYRSWRREQDSSTIENRRKKWVWSRLPRLGSRVTQVSNGRSRWGPPRALLAEPWSPPTDGKGDRWPSQAREKSTK